MPRPRKSAAADSAARITDPIIFDPAAAVTGGEDLARLREEPSAQGETATAAPPARLAWRDDARGLFLYHGNCLELLDRLAERHPSGLFDCVWADPLYFLSNGGITCHAGRMVRVDKGTWDKSRGAELNHEFNREWLARCQRLLKPNGTLWVSGTHHVIFSIGFALQQLGFKLLNSVSWEKPNPPPNLACRYFTHSTETVLWAAKNERSKHRFHYQEMRGLNGGKQMKDVWRMTAPGAAEKIHGKHPTQKPLALVERCLRASTDPGDFLLDPFSGGGTTALACLHLARRFLGCELDTHHIGLTMRRAEAEVITWFYRLRVERRITMQVIENDLDLFGEAINRSDIMPDPEPAPESPPDAERVFHETRLVFLSAAHVSEAAVVHTTVDVSLRDAWANAPHSTRRATTHVVCCETEILRLRKTP